MATRAVICIEGMTPVIYKHYDGYPENTLPWLKEFNEKFTKIRGKDSQYKFAQLLRSSVRDAEKHQLDTSDTTGWGVFNEFVDAGQDFTYLLKDDGSVTYKRGHKNPQEE